MKYSLFSLLSSFILLAGGCANNISTPHPIILKSGEVRFAKPLKTWKELREQNIVMQKLDYSCGAAALATLMRYYFQEDIVEKEVLEDITNHLDKKAMKQRREEGFSLLDLKQFAERRGYQAVGVKLKFSALPKLRGPVLVYLDTREYKHFAILRGAKNDRVFIADPERGNLRMSAYEFSKEWAGVTLVLGKKGFGTPNEYLLKIQEQETRQNELNVIRKSLIVTDFGDTIPP
ncbi:C39 family peptidase [Thiotrichales bacterium HSG14]|nr:C39 family peptidase [Thiotrichales bacterium HSG14]